MMSGNLMASWMKNTGILLPDNVPVAFLGVELDGEAAHIARQVSRSLAAGDGGKAYERGRALSGTLKQVGAGVFRERLVGFEVSVRAVASRVHHPLRNPFVIKVENLLAKMEVFNECRAAWP